VSLWRLLVREKAETTRGGDPSTSASASGPGGGAGGDVGGRGFYVISESLSASPEMYELQCRSADDRRQCVDRIRAATEQCPQPHDHGTTRPTATQVAWCICLFNSHRTLPIAIRRPVAHRLSNQVREL